ncbi:hypothetical protein BH18ACT1_BH18ACT1_11980 [soil metagenome]|nr:hypothetical protein [Acidimicrobiia bacterium]
MRSVAGYVLAPILALLLLGGGIALIVVGVTSYNDRIEDFQRFELQGVPGSVELDDTGGYSVYFEPDDDGVGLSSAYRDPPVLVQVRDAGGEPVDVEEYDSEVTYEVSGRRGVGLYTFSADEPGTYTITVAGASGGVGAAEGLGDIAVGRGIGTRLAGSLVAGISLLALGPLVGALLAIATFLRRSRARRRVATPAFSAG